MNRAKKTKVSQVVPAPEVAVDAGGPSQPAPPPLPLPPPALASLAELAVELPAGAVARPMNLLERTLFDVAELKAKVSKAKKHLVIVERRGK